MKIIFCGGCNPLYNRMSVYQKIHKELEKNKIYDFLILNGCHRGCKKIDSKYKVISISDFFIQNTPANWTEEKLIAWIYEKVDIIDE